MRTLSWLIASVAYVLLLVSLPALAAPAKPLAFFVSPTGNDAWTGTLATPNATKTDGPFATLTRARDAVRELKAKGPLTAPVMVRVRGGKYYVTETLAFGPQDSGTDQFPITYAAFPGETPELIGGRRLEGFKPAAKGQVAWDLPEVKEGKWRFRSLFLDGQRQIRARFPNFDPANPRRGGFLYAQVDAGGLGGTVGAIHNPGDWMDYKVNVPADGDYNVWVHYGADNSPWGLADMADHTGLTVDGGEPVMLKNLPNTGSFAITSWSRCASLHLTAGAHTVRWTNFKGGGINLGGMLLTDDPACKPAGRNIPEMPEGRHLIIIQVDRFVAFNGKQLSASADGGGSKTSVAVKPEVFKSAWLAPDAEMHIFQSGDCRAFMEILNITSYDPNTGSLQVGGKEATSTLTAGDRYWIDNVYEELDSPGEWYLNTQTGTLSYQPPTGFSAKSEVIAPTLGRMLDLEGDAVAKTPVSNLHFSGLTFRCTDWALGEGCSGYGMGSDGTIFGKNATGCAVENCTFVSVGKNAVVFNGGEGNRVAGCDISHTGGGGVLLESSARNTVTDNHIHDIGEAYRHNGGVVMEGGGSSDNVVSHNAIHDTPRYGISFKGAGTNNVVEYNFIQNTSLETNDTGAIEVTQGDRNALSGSKIRYNLVLDSVAYSTTLTGPTFMAWSIYLDSFAGGYEVTGNVCARAAFGGIMLQGGKGNTITNNIFVDGNQFQGFLTNYLGNWANEVVEGNIFAWSNPQARVFGYGKLTTDILRMDRNLYSPPDGTTLAFGWGGAVPLPEWQKMGFDVNGAVADPQFLAPQKDDYRLRPTSPAFKLGFRPVDITRANLVGKRCTCRITPQGPLYWTDKQPVGK
jgi:parallel beta-helix repeat protein